MALKRDSQRRSDGQILSVALLAGALGVLAVVGALLLGDRRVAIGALVFTAATHLVLAVRLRRLLSAVDRSEPEASAGLP